MQKRIPFRYQKLFGTRTPLTDDPMSIESALAREKSNLSRRNSRQFSRNNEQDIAGADPGRHASPADPQEERAASSNGFADLLDGLGLIGEKFCWFDCGGSHSRVRTESSAQLNSLSTYELSIQGDLSLQIPGYIALSNPGADDPNRLRDGDLSTVLSVTSKVLSYVW